MTLAPRFVAAVDFGTDNTVLAWAETTDQQVRLLVPQPTALLLDDGGGTTACGRAAVNAALDGQRAYYSHFKTVPVDGFDSVELASRYLAWIYDWAMGIFGDHRVAWWITVPATWPYRQRQLLRIAAERAGFPANDLELVIAPEAAAHYCWDELALADGDRFVVVDAGSGIVDVASYRITGGRLAELSAATGGPFGGHAIDELFLDTVVRARRGADATGPLFADDAQRLFLLADWERAKRAVDPDHKGARYLSLPAGLGTVMLWPEDMKALFDPVVDPVIDLVREHVGAAGPGSPVRVVLVGGCAESRYVVARFRDAFGDVLVPPAPADAVPIGALRAALRPAVASRVSRFTYGIDVQMPFERGKDRRRRRKVDGYGEVRCRNRFFVFVHAGQSVDVGSRVTHQLGPLDPTHTEFSLPVYTSEQPEPRYTDEQGSARVGELTVDIHETVGRPMNDRLVDVTMTFGNAEITVDSRDPHTGAELSTTIDFVTVG